MRNYKKYRSIVIDLFQSFLAEKIEKRQPKRITNILFLKLYQQNNITST